MDQDKKSGMASPEDVSASQGSAGADAPKSPQLFTSTRRGTGYMRLSAEDEKAYLDGGRDYERLHAEAESFAQRKGLWNMVVEGPERTICELEVELVAARRTA